MQPLKNIAILGATSHIAKGLIHNFLETQRYRLFLFARSTDSVHSFVKEQCEHSDACILPFDGFDTGQYDVIINCVGFGDPCKLKNAGTDVFEVIEHYDALALHYLMRNPHTLYIHCSSGAVYGVPTEYPVHDDTKACIPINQIEPVHHYGIAKLYAEAKHRAYAAYRIVDLRIFSYFSRFIDLHTGYLISHIITCCKEKKTFVTTPSNIVRDYVHPNDFFHLVQHCMANEKINDAVDVYSAQPISKFEILDYFHHAYGLQYEITRDAAIINVTGEKDRYYSTSRKAEKIGYIPRYTSLDVIREESKIFLKST